jgi:hypothetical protein
LEGEIGDGRWEIGDGGAFVAFGEVDARAFMEIGEERGCALGRMRYALTR